MRRVSAAGFGLAEMLVGLVLTLVVTGVAVAFLSHVARTSLAHPVSAEEQQRARAAFDQLSALVSRAGEGIAGQGPGAGTLPVPVLYPQRRGVPGADPDTAASGSSITIVAAASDPRATATLLLTMPSPSAAIVVDPASCGPGRASCGFTVGNYALIADARASGEWFRVDAASAGSLNHPPLAGAYSPARFAGLTGVDVRALWFDNRTSQLRLSSPASDVPLLDEVAAFTVEWYGDPRAPPGPVPPPGEENCVVSASGTPKLPPRGATHGPWVRLSLSDLSDGPWCGQPPWRFDADLYRVRLVRLDVQWQDSPARFAARSPGSAAPRLGLRIAPPNLMRGG